MHRIHHLLPLLAAVPLFGPLPPNDTPLDVDPWADVTPGAPLRADAPKQEKAPPSLEESDRWRVATPSSRRVRRPFTIDVSDPWAP